MSHMEWEYVNGAAADEITMRWNREAFDHIRLNPRVLNDVSRLDTRVTLFGQELPFPILLAPTALHRLAHPQGEMATARGASQAHAAMVLSTKSRSGSFPGKRSTAFRAEERAARKKNGLYAGSA